jgi:hypothetical protein
MLLTLPTLRALLCAENRLSCQQRAPIGKLEVLNVEVTCGGGVGSVDISRFINRQGYSSAIGAEQRPACR